MLKLLKGFHWCHMHPHMLNTFETQETYEKVDSLCELL